MCSAGGGFGGMDNMGNMGGFGRDMGRMGGKETCPLLPFSPQSFFRAL